MARIQCPNFTACHTYLNIRNNLDDSEYPEGNMENNICIELIPVRDGNFTLIKLNKPLPVCWGCGSSYSDIENIHQNEYLSFIDSIECCICLKTDRGVSFPNCKHYTCITCHNRCWFGPPEIYPEFPYGVSIKKLFYSDRSNDIWKQDLKIKEYIKEECRLEHERMDQEKNLRKCPLCRK